MNSFILLKEERERIKKLYEATTSSSSGAFSQPMAFTEVEELVDFDETFIDGDNIVDGSVEINLDLDDITELLGLSELDENKRIKKLHKDNSTIKEENEEPCIGLECPECMSCAGESLVGTNPLPFVGGKFDYRGDAIEVVGGILEIMGGETPDPTKLVQLYAKLAWKFPRMAMDGPVIFKNMYDAGCIKLCLPDTDLGSFLVE